MQCDICGKKRKIIYKEYISNVDNGNYYACSRKCGINKKVQTVVKKYGVKNVSQLDEIKEKKRETSINNRGEIYFNFFPKYNPNSILYLDIISEKIGIKIQHALNGGEKKFVKYWVDDYIEEYNICIEWDEKHHNLTKKKKKDNDREIFLKKNFGCVIVRINENDFMNNIYEGIAKTIDSINNIIISKKEKHGK